MIHRDARIIRGEQIRKLPLFRTFNEQTADRKHFATRLSKARSNLVVLEAFFFSFHRVGANNFRAETKLN